MFTNKQKDRAGGRKEREGKEKKEKKVRKMELPYEPRTARGLKLTYVTMDFRRSCLHALSAGPTDTPSNLVREKLETESRAASEQGEHSIH